jgi:hypothetical protein
MSAIYRDLKSKRQPGDRRKAASGISSIFIANSGGSRSTIRSLDCFPRHCADAGVFREEQSNKRREHRRTVIRCQLIHLVRYPT